MKLRVSDYSGQQGDQTSQSRRKSTLNTHWKDWCWSWTSGTLATWCEELTHWKRPWCWERLKAKGEEGGRAWDDWMASLIQWTWTWANSRRRWGTGKPGVLQSMGLQRVRHDLVTEQQQITFNINGVDTEASKLKYKDWWPEKYFVLLTRDVFAIRRVIKHWKQKDENNIGKILILPKLIYKCNVFPIKIPTGCLLILTSWL